MKHKRRLDLSGLIAFVAIFSITSSVSGQAKFLGKGHVQEIQFSSDGEWLAIGTSALLEVYSTNTYQPICVIDINVDTLAFSLDGTELLVGNNQTLHQFEILSGREITHLDGHESGITDAVYSPAEDLIASIDGRGVVRLWRDGHQETSFRQAASSRFDYWVLFSPDGRRLYVGTSGLCPDLGYHCGRKTCARMERQGRRGKSDTTS